MCLKISEQKSALGGTKINRIESICCFAALRKQSKYGYCLSLSLSSFAADNAEV